MEQLQKNKTLYLALSAIGLCSLVSAFANPLQKLEVYRQTEQGNLGNTYEKTYIITESDKLYPYGFLKEKAEKVAQVYVDFQVQKWGFCLLAVSCSLYCLYLGKSTVPNVEIQDEIETIRLKGKKEVLLERVKHTLAMASVSQRREFQDEMKELMEIYGTLEQDTQQANEILATDKFVNASFLLGEGHSADTVVTQTWDVQPGTEEHTKLKQKFLDWQSEGDEIENTVKLSTVNFRSKFSETMDGIYRNAVMKEIERGSGREKIVSDVLQCDDLQLGLAYIQFLIDKS